MPAREYIMYYIQRGHHKCKPAVLNKFTVNILQSPQDPD